MAWIRDDPYAIDKAIKSSKETFPTNKVKIEEETTTTPNFFYWVGV